MLKRKIIVAGNWKMNLDLQAGYKLTEDVIAGVKTIAHVETVFCTPLIHLVGVSAQTNNHSHMSTAAQNIYPKPSGAYTGEVSTAQVKSAGATYVLVGHSERREYFHEDNQFLAAKVDAVLAEGLTPIFCCGESLAIREGGEYLEYVANQIQESLFHLASADIEKVVIAYEPIWAIGTGLTASPEQAQEMHSYIRKTLASKYGETTAESISILYGGSVKSSNAADIFSKPDVDGGLVGGASLQADEFIKIVASA
jgi:triosephosphate isomerase